MEEVLNLEYHYKIMSLKALNRCKTMDEAAFLLGITKRTLQRWIKNFGIVFDKNKGEYILKQNTVIVYEFKKLYIGSPGDNING